MGRLLPGARLRGPKSSLRANRIADYLKTPLTSAWTWDPTLFAGAAPYYEKGRLPYAPGPLKPICNGLIP